MARRRAKRAGRIRAGAVVAGPGAAAGSEIEKARDWVKNRERAGLETATPERLAKATEEGYERTDTNVQRIVEAPLDRMWRRGLITRREYEAGERFREDAYAAAVDPGPGVVDLAGVPSGFGPRTPSMFASQRIANARLRHRRIERALKPSLIWDLVFLGLVKEQPMEVLGGSIFADRSRDWAMAAGQAGLRVALAALADAYARMDRGG